MTRPTTEAAPTPSPHLPPQDAPTFVQSGAGDIRIGPILAIPQVLQALHARPQTAFDNAGVSLALFQDPDARLPLEVAARLFAECARLADCPHFALLVGERFNLDGLGPLGELMRHSPNIGAALRSLLLHLQLHDRGAAPLLLQTEPDTAMLGYSVYRHFALLVGERFSLDGLGPLGELMRHSPNVGAALRSLLLHLQLHDRGAAPLLLQTEPDTAMLGYSVYRHFTPGTEFIYDVALAIGHRILQGLCGPAFVPLAVQFSYRRPAHTAAYRRLFQAPLNFDAEVSGLVFASHWLARPIEDADPGRHQALTHALQQAQATGPLSLGEQVELVLHQMLLSGHGTAEAVAQQFGISQRTLRRRLDTEGKSFQVLVNRTRHELACQLLRNTQLPVTHIAAALQYADANAFSRAFRQWTGHTPTAWRAAGG